jgi:hypothetical protein
LGVAEVRLHQQYQCGENGGRVTKGDQKDSPKRVREGGDGGQRNGNSYRTFRRTKIKRSE